MDVNGGQHHRYFLVAEGASDRTLAPFSLPSLAAYEDHRALSWVHPDFIAADQIRATTGCVSRYDRSFMRSLLPDSDERSAIRPRRPAEAEQ